MSAVSILERFEAKYIPEPNCGCWLWTASLDGKGYGQFQIGTRAAQKLVRAHRFAYEQAKGPIPKGLDLDHKCRVRSCVNPDHLEPVTRSENLRRGVGPTLTKVRRAAQTHCKRGHPLDGWNGSSRFCKICRAHSIRQWGIDNRERREAMRRKRRAAKCP